MSSCKASTSDSLRLYCWPQSCEPFSVSTNSVCTINVSPRCRTRPVTRALTPRSRPTFCRSVDRKSTRLNSSHVAISYAVFCLKKKKKNKTKLMQKKKKKKQTKKKKKKKKK